MGAACELCLSEQLEEAYAPAGGNVRVTICTHCGLVQSRQTDTPAASSWVDFEKFRTAREFRARFAIETISLCADLAAPLRVVECGAGRGAFVREFLRASPRGHVTAVEADPRRSWGCAFLGRSEIVSKPIEEASFERECFDIAYSSAFEHLPSALSVLSELWRILRPGGLLVLDTRNLSALREDGGIEEWFLPRSNRYFSERTLARMVRARGFELIEPTDRGDAENILFAAVKSQDAYLDDGADMLEVRSARALISVYSGYRQRNLSALNVVTEELNRMAPRGVVLWGGGKLLESLRRHGGLDPAIVSARLGGEANDRNPICDSDLHALSESQPGVIVLMSDTRTAEIGYAAARYAPKSEIVHFSDLVLRAYRGQAA